MHVSLFLAILVAAMPISESDAVNATEAVQHELRVDNIDASMAYEKPFVVLFWSAGDGHGQALLQREGQDVALLRSLGVPAATAKALVKDLTQFKAP